MEYRFLFFSSSSHRIMSRILSGMPVDVDADTGAKASTFRRLDFPSFAIFPSRLSSRLHDLFMFLDSGPSGPFSLRILFQRRSLKSSPIP